MVKYVKKYSTTTEYNTFINTNPTEDYIIYCNDTKKTHFVHKNYFKFEVVNDGTITWRANSTNNTKTISYSTDNGATWTSVTSSTSGVSLGTFNAGQKVLIKGTNMTYGTSSYYNYFGGTAKVNVYGNIMSLIYGDNFTNQTTLTTSYTFRYLFNGYSNLLSAEYLVLPATTLTNYCYDNMFYNCTSLVTAPELPATTLADSCYRSMFEGCTLLVSAPELPATTLADYCYDSMFYNCTSLVSAPELPATTLANVCYSNMFYGCTSLVTAPELPATTLANSCYSTMFYGCTSLVTAPELPATTLTNGCYSSMFSGCTSLVTAPELPATTLADYCYYYMFYGCTSLVTAPVLPALALQEGCYDSMFYNTSIDKVIALFITKPSDTYTYHWLYGTPQVGIWYYNDNSSMTWHPDDTQGENYGLPDDWAADGYYENAFGTDTRLVMWIDDFIAPGTEPSINTLDDRAREAGYGNIEDYLDHYFSDLEQSGCNKYVYMGDKFIYNGKKYYIWVAYDVYDGMSSVKYILTTTIDFDELYCHSMEYDYSNEWCPYVAILDSDTNVSYDIDDNRYDWLVKIEKEEI